MKDTQDLRESVDGHSTKDRILNAAEKLFGELGYDGTSLRAVTSRAGVNLAAVNYHFGSKMGLFQGVFERRAGPLNAERLAALDRLEAAAGPDGRVPVADLLTAFFEAPVRKITDGDPGFREFLRIVGRMESASGEHAKALLPVFAEVRDRFQAAFRRSLPDLDVRDLTWRVHLLLGSMCTLFADPQRIAIHSEGVCNPSDGDEVLAQLVAFGRGALEAGPTSALRG